MKRVLYILGGLSDRDFNWLITMGKRLPISVGTTLIREGKSIDALYIILDGMFSVCTEASGGQEIARLSEGEIVGEISFVDSRPPTATVTAIKNSVVWSISQRQLAQKLLQDTDFASHFYQAIAIFLADRLRLMVSRLGSNQGEQWAQNLDEIESQKDLNPNILGSLEMAQDRLNWLLHRLQDIR